MKQLISHEKIFYMKKFNTNVSYFFSASQLILCRKKDVLYHHLEG